MKGFPHRPCKAFGALLCCWHLNACGDAIKLGDAAENAFAGTFNCNLSESAWINGETIPGFYAFRDCAAIETIRTTGGLAVNGGIYSITNSTGEHVAIGLLAPQKHEILFGAVFTNDTAGVFTIDNIRYTASQRGFRNTETQTLETVLATVKPPAAPDWQSSPDWNFQTAVCTEPQPCEIVFSPPRLKIPPGRLAYVFWRLAGPQNGSSAIAAIEKLEIEFTFTNGTRISVR